MLMTNSDERNERRINGDVMNKWRHKKAQRKVAALRRFGMSVTQEQSSRLSSDQLQARWRLVGTAESLSSGFPVSMAG
ncbi:hypothetical protein ACOMICROBIO_EPCKBFOG_00055 [Vibrio sp. B1FLJ16]|nr:hypothetical protein ACOMICROBIO_EPCKBFOG_00055 [Vibrio sp. B1FLJ16]CAD7796757.1 hypothetical protein ACOMICROBIO_FLGHMIGD_00064 [Vibrio sp. B1FLJ16]CAE6878277.1 hypothetical protein ACOMICROBIO_FLGHMIGD_00064 [Vibrio sp. B1FLJ16]CAE6878953.1 hypothetical protein ACOMICROBIO_EPCKBFOG_00055 [Vibrio sp. B1FLJ16]